MTQTLEQALRDRFQKVRKTKGKNGLELRVCCPYCPDPDRKFKLYINPSRGLFNCYRCHKSGTLRRLLGTLYSPSFMQMQVQQHREKEEPLPDNIRSPGASCPVKDLPYDHPAFLYLDVVRKRRPPLDHAEMSDVFGVRYCERGIRIETDDFSYDTTNTLIFPVWMFGRLVGWQSRLLYDPDSLSGDECIRMGMPKDEDGEILRPPKYMTSPGLRKGRVLYNFDQARKYPYVVVTEGVFDCMSVGPAAVATFGTGISEQQCRLLKTYWSTVIIMLDPEGTDETTEDLYNELYRAVGVLHVKLKGGFKDPGDTPREEIWRQISSASQNLIKTEQAIIGDGLAIRARQARPESGGGLWRMIGKIK